MYWCCEKEGSGEGKCGGRGREQCCRGMEERGVWGEGKGG